ncbi:MAG: hypothetical protein R3F61_07910 [Myxococcota bacterium]
MDHPHLDRYRPPEGFVLVRSHLDGVEVYAPVAVDEVMEQRVRCAGCGASIAWDPGRQALHCSYCGTTSEARRGRDEGEGEFTAESLARGARGWGTERPELHCEGCGAVLTLDPGHLAATCPFCASSRVTVRETTEDALRPTRVLPFRVQSAEAVRTAREWLGRGWLRPPGVVEAAQLDRFLGVYLPYWVFGAHLTCAYECEVGTDRWVTVRRDGRTERQRVTDWVWKSGQVAFRSDGVVVPGTARVAGLDRVGSFPLESVVPYTPDVLVGFAAHSYDVALPEAWDTGRARLRSLAADAAKSNAGGDRQRNFSASVDLNEESWSYALLPVWLSTYTWDGRRWVLVVNGASGEVGGTRPVAWSRVYLAILALLTPGFFTGVCIGLPTLLFMGFGLVVWIFAFILIGLGGIGSVVLYNHALGEERL